MIVTLLLSFVVGLLATEQNGEVNWGYEGKTGPKYWPRYFEECGGYRQSPINVDCNYVRYRDLDSFNFDDYSGPLGNSRLINLNGRTIEVVPSKNISISGGSLPDIFIFQQLHFHWGRHEYEGSEHSYEYGFNPLEAHFVHWNAKYGNMENALQYEDGILVVASFFTINEISPGLMTEITNNIDEVLYKNQEVDIFFNSPLDDLLPENTGEYFRYRGSLTTPECNEVVTWILLKNTVDITRSDLSAFRQVRRTAVGEPEKFLTRNFRPIQPLNGRIIESNADCYY